MSTFTIITEGIAVSYLKDDAWKILFPFDDCHILKLKLKLGEGTDISATAGIPLGQGGRVEIDVVDPLTRASKGPGYNDFLDLTDDNMHNTLIPRTEAGASNHFLLSMPFAVLSPEDYTNRRYRLVNQDISVAPTTQFRKIGNRGRAIIEGSEITVRVSGPEINFSMTFSESTTILFDNDCEKQTTSEHGDLDMVYGLLRDADLEAMKFMVEPEKLLGTGSEVSINGNGNGNGAARMRSSYEGAATVMGTVGYSDVAVMEAPRTRPQSPGIAPEDSDSPQHELRGGLPCNKFQISKNLENLPS